MVRRTSRIDAVSTAHHFPGSALNLPGARNAHSVTIVYKGSKQCQRPIITQDYPLQTRSRCIFRGVIFPILQSIMIRLRLSVAACFKLVRSPLSDIWHGAALALQETWPSRRYLARSCISSAGNLSASARCLVVRCGQRTT